MCPRLLVPLADVPQVSCPSGWCPRLIVPLMITSATSHGKQKKRFPNRDLRWKGLANVFAMRSLVLKHDIATMYREYLVKQKATMPRKPPIGKSMFDTMHSQQYHGWWKTAGGTGMRGLHNS